MPTTEANTPIAKSLLPAAVDEVAVHLPSDVIYQDTPQAKEEIQKLESQIDLESIQAYQKAANFLAVSMIYLQSNGLVAKELTQEDVKPRLLGHFGTCPGIIFVYAHLTALISRHATPSDTPSRHRYIFILGPGHGAPGVLAPLYLEGALTRSYPLDYPLSPAGAEKMVHDFSWPASWLPSHVNAYTPGSIHEGGELGYSLAVSWGAVMDKPDLIVACLVGDGEAETGPASAAWHGHKFIDPQESGAVLPILHVNGYKISERTLFGSMDDREVVSLFSGYGYQVRVVSHPRPTEGKTYTATNEEIPPPGSEGSKLFDLDFAATLEWARDEIDKIQKAARGDGKPIDKPRWPMIVLRSPKGWGGPKHVDGKRVENSFRAHQVPLTVPKTDKTQFESLKKWLESYEPKKYFNPSASSEGGVGVGGGGGVDDDQEGGGFVSEVVNRILPKRLEYRMGLTRETNGGAEELKSLDWKSLTVEKGVELSAMKVCGSFLSKFVELNPKSFRIFSPDELASNKLDPVFDVTGRNMQWDPETAHSGGRVIEMLSEHTLQGFLQGYALTGRSGLFPSYEAFLPIVTTMICQYAKFIKMAKETRWRQPVPSLNYIETSTLWRQEHNGFSHQNPGLINTILDLPHDIARIYFPPDANTWLSTIDHCLKSKQYVNLMVGSKTVGPTWLTASEAEKHCAAGGSIWKQYSSFSGIDPDIVLVGTPH